MCKQVSEQMAEPGADMDALMTRMDRLQTQIEAADGWELERQLERAMDALRCPPGKQNMPYCSPIPKQVSARLCAKTSCNSYLLCMGSTQPWRQASRSRMSMSCSCCIGTNELLLA